MAQLLRIISASKWTFAMPTDMDALPADVISQDMRTKNNALSVYKLDDTSELLDNIILGYASTRLNFRKVEYLLVDEKTLDNEGYTLKQSPGDTLLSKANNAHFEVVDLQAKTLTKLAWLFTKVIESGKTVVVPTPDIKKRVTAAIESGILKKDDLEEEMQKSC